MKDQLSYNLIDNIVLNSPGIVAQLDLFLRKNKNIKKMSLRDVSSICPEQKDVTSILVGLWALDFLKSSPNIYNKIKSNDFRLSNSDIKIISTGLVDIIRHSNFEIPEDDNAIEYHYAACLRLYRLLGDEAEDILVEELLKHPTIAILRAIGFLVGHEIKGSIKRKTFCILNEIAEADSDKLSIVARDVLIEDVARVNAINHFL